MPGGRLRSSRTQTTVVATTASALPRRCGDPTSSHQRCRLTVPRTGSARSATSPTGTGGASSWPVSTIITVGSRSAGTRSSVPGRPAPCARVGSRPDSRSAARSCRHRLRRDDRVPAQRRGAHVVPAPSPEDAGADNCPARSADAFFGPAGAVVDCGPVVHIGPECPSQAQSDPSQTQARPKPGIGPDDRRIERRFQAVRCSWRGPGRDVKPDSSAWCSAAARAAAHGRTDRGRASGLLKLRPAVSTDRHAPADFMTHIASAATQQARPRAQAAPATISGQASVHRFT